jgi:hypothetical protein
MEKAVYVRWNRMPRDIFDKKIRNRLRFIPIFSNPDNPVFEARWNE